MFFRKKPQKDILQNKIEKNIQIIRSSSLPIFFIGMMGSGKTTLGKVFAQKIGYEFIEMDETIEKSNNMSISQIFEEKSEEFFRHQETALLQSLVIQKNTVISCGGGTFTSQYNINLINQYGVSVFLNVNSKVIEFRLKNDTKRPLLKNECVTNILLKRIPFYTQAHVMVDINLKTIEDNVNKIIKELARHLA